MTKEGEDLITVVNIIIASRRDEDLISPAWIATEAMTRLDGEMVQKTRPLIYLGCHLHLRQIARAACRNMFEPGDDVYQEGRQHELFPDLQWRYPRRGKKGEDPQYIKLEEMSDDDIAFNIERLRHEGKAKLAHADALEAFRRRRAGVSTARG